MCSYSKPDDVVKKVLLLHKVYYFQFHYIHLSQQRVHKSNQRGLENEKEFPLIASFIFRTPEDLRKGIVCYYNSFQVTKMCSV